MLKGLVKIKIFDKIVAYKKKKLVKKIYTRNYFNLIKLISKLLIKLFLRSVLNKYIKVDHVKVLRTKA